MLAVLEKQLKSLSCRRWNAPMLADLPMLQDLPATRALPGLPQAQPSSSSSEQVPRLQDAAHAAVAAAGAPAVAATTRIPGYAADFCSLGALDPSSLQLWIPADPSTQPSAEGIGAQPPPGPGGEETPPPEVPPAITLEELCSFNDDPGFLDAKTAEPGIYADLFEAGPGGAQDRKEEQEEEEVREHLEQRDDGMSLEQEQQEPELEQPEQQEQATDSESEGGGRIFLSPHEQRTFTPFFLELCALLGLSNPPPAEGTDEAERNEEGGALAEAARLFDIEPEGHTHRVRHGCPRLQAHFAARGAERLRALAAEAAAAAAQDQ